MKRCILVTIFLMLTVSASVFSQYIATGKVISGDNKEGLPGVSIKLQNGNKGVYTVKDGRFRMPIETSSVQVLVSSLGFQQSTVVISADKENLIILTPLPLQAKEVLVTADILPEEIIRRARANKERNKLKLRTFEGDLYSKLVFQMQGDVFGQIGEENKGQILETFSLVANDNTSTPPRSRVIIQKRRQTANVPSDNNLLSISEFIDFYDDNIRIFNALLPSPLGEDFEQDYLFTILERKQTMYGIAYVLQVTPKSSIAPAFEGTITITDGDYTPVAFDMRPSKATAISFVRDVRYRQDFQEISEGLWGPSYLEVTAKAQVQILKGVAELDIDVRVESFFTRIAVNQPLADSLFAASTLPDTLETRREFNRRGTSVVISAPKSADSVAPEFWQQQGVTPLSDNEEKLFKRIDSLAALSNDSSAGTAPSVGFILTPAISFNRTLAYGLGGTLGIQYDNLRAELYGFYSTGQEKLLGTASVSYSPVRKRSWGLFLRASTFSRISPNIQEYEDLPTSSRALFFEDDIRDYFLEEGYDATISARYSRLSLSLTGRLARNYSVSNTTRTLWTDEEYRSNPAIQEGLYRTADVALEWNAPNNVLSISNSVSTTLRGGIYATLGNAEGTHFSKISGLLRFLQPTFSTGYIPMYLSVAVHAGIGSDNLPLHHQYMLAAASYFMPRFNHFPSARGGVWGGTEFIAVHAEHSFGDLLWRALGLPLYEGRGLEFIAIGRFAKYNNFSPIQHYKSSPADSYFAEAGIGIGKIPIFISNVLFFRSDFTYSFGADGFANRLGLALTLSSPF